MRGFARSRRRRRRCIGSTRRTVGSRSSATSRVVPMASASRPTTRGSTSPTPGLVERSASGTWTGGDSGTGDAMPSSTPPGTDTLVAADGIRCDVEGNVWAGAGEGVLVVAPDGDTIGAIRLPGALCQCVLRRHQTQPPVHDRQPVAVCGLRRGPGGGDRVEDPQGDRRQEKPDGFAPNPGCSAGRMQRDFHHGLLGFPGAVSRQQSADTDDPGPHARRPAAARAVQGHAQGADASSATDGRARSGTATRLTGSRAQLQSVGCITTERISYTHDPAPRTPRWPRRDPSPAESHRAHADRWTHRPQPGTGRVAAPSSAIGGAAVSCVIRWPSPTRRCAPSTARSRPTGHGRRSFAQRSGRPPPTRCTSSGRTWMVTASVRPPTTTGPGTAIVMELARIFNAADVQTGTVDPLRAVEQRGDRARRERRVCGAAPGATGPRTPARVWPDTRSRGGSG